MIRAMISSSRQRWTGALLVAVGFLLQPAAARADAGIPMMPVKYPAILLFLLPVILIETVYLRMQLHTRWRRTAIAVAGINICTTAIGYPLSWALFTGLDLLIGLPPHGPGVFEHMGWLPIWVCERIYPGWPGLQEQAWPVLLIFGVLMVPSFFLSGAIKGWLTHGYDLLHCRGSVREESWAATRLSYLFLAGSGCVLLYLTYARV